MSTSTRRRGLVAPPAEGTVWDLAARLGFRDALLDCTAGPVGGHLNAATVRLARAGLASVAVVEDPTIERILGQLESGVGGLCHWRPESAEAVRAVVEACYYAPRGGIRGMATVRPARYGLGAPLPELIAGVGDLSVGVALPPGRFTAETVAGIAAALPEAIAPGRGLHFVALALEPDEADGGIEPRPAWREAAERAAAEGLDVYVWGSGAGACGGAPVAVEAVYLEQLLAAGALATAVEGGSGG